MDALVEKLCNRFNGVNGIFPYCILTVHFLSI
jgi:hypothetical protein